MSNDEQMLVIGQMVTERKELRQKEGALAHQVARASNTFRGLSGLLANYSGGDYNETFKVEPDMEEIANMEYVMTLVTDLIETRQQLAILQRRLDQVS